MLPLSRGVSILTRGVAAMAASRATTPVAVVAAPPGALGLPEAAALGWGVADGVASGCTAGACFLASSACIWACARCFSICGPL